MPTMQSIAAVLRSEIAKSPDSVYRLAKETGVHQPVLSRFVSGERGLSLENAEHLLGYFGYRLVKAADAAPAPKPRPVRPAVPKPKKKPPRV